MPGKYLRGAFIQFTSAFLVPVPNVIVFQYNPETMTHTWQSSGLENSTAGQAHGHPLATGGDPGEEFSFSISMDAGDTVADGTAPASALASVSGVYPRLAALELLLFPSPPSAADAVAGTCAAGAVGSLIGAAAGIQRSVPSSTVPTVLFVWGPGRVLPVRVTSLRVTEKLFDSTLLFPTHADAEIGLRVLTQPEINALDDGLIKGILNTSYTYMSKLRKGLAASNAVNTGDSIIGMLPF